VAGRFYGPKSTVKIEDAIGDLGSVPRSSLDFNLPERFTIWEYVAADGRSPNVRS